MFNTKITWGDELTLALRRAGGLQPVAKQLREILGFLAPSRATLAKLQKVERPDQLNDEDTFRAWLVLVAIGEDPGRWQLLPIAVPGVFNVDLYRTLIAMSREPKNYGEPSLNTRRNGASSGYSERVIHRFIRRVPLPEITPTPAPHIPAHRRAA